MAAKSNLRLVKSATEKRAVAPRRQPNRELRSREYLTETEVEKLIEATKDNRYGHRDPLSFLEYLSSSIFPRVSFLEYLSSSSAIMNGRLLVSAYGHRLVRSVRDGE